ncbi:hypothetical protein JRO89_XS03G0250200 [Xanthoceras sorbifolium]|uniref:Uncharacterized protein n=1 Tax=Xanthoceras sorbifolium TaxID=99658 RepID=A0ABQ8IC74_9ROSI|nr:hypothetical protein JRO89_XS03G0250200 [Xanthoceras sorbifolium]
MATPQEKPLNISETSPLREEDDGFEEYEEGLRSNGCGCFQGLCFRWKRRNNNGGGGNTHALRDCNDENAKNEALNGTATRGDFVCLDRTAPSSLILSAKVGDFERRLTADSAKGLRGGAEAEKVIDDCELKDLGFVGPMLFGIIRDGVRLMLDLGRVEMVKGRDIDFRIEPFWLKEEKLEKLLGQDRNPGLADRIRILGSEIESLWAKDELY